MTEIADLWDNKFPEIRSESWFGASRSPPLAFRATGVEGVKSPTRAESGRGAGAADPRPHDGGVHPAAAPCLRRRGSDAGGSKHGMEARGKGVGLGTCVALLRENRKPSSRRLW